MTRVGVLGSGWVANQRYLPVLASRQDADVVALYDRNLGRAQESARRHGVPVATDDLEEFFAQDPAAVTICSSPWSHAELALASFDRRCHVLTEKPMAMNGDEALRMAAAAEASDRVLCVSHNFIFSHAVRRADVVLQGGGHPRFVLGMQLSSDRRRLPAWHENLPGGLLFDEIPHLLYMMQHYLGRIALDSVRVSGRSDRGHPVTTEILLKGVHGPGQATIISAAPVSEWHVTIIAPHRVVDLDLFRDIAIDVPADNAHRASDILKTSARAVAGHLWGFARSGSRLTTSRLYWGHDVLIGRFLDAAMGTAQSPVSIEDALSVVAVTDDILAAIGER
jgi:predicted dehydrogenase